MIKFGIRKYGDPVLAPKTVVVAYDESNTQLSFDQSKMDPHIGEVVACIYFDELGRQVRSHYARLRGAYVESQDGHDTWVIEIETFHDTEVLYSL